MKPVQFLALISTSIPKTLRNICSKENNHVNSFRVMSHSCELFKNDRSAIRATKYKLSDRVLGSIIMRDDGTFLNYRRPYDYSNGFLVPTSFILEQMEAIRIIAADLSSIRGIPDWVSFYIRVEAKRKALIKEHKIK